MTDSAEIDLARLKVQDESIAIIRDALIAHFNEDRVNFNEARKNFKDLTEILAPIADNMKAASRLGKWIMVLLGALALVATIFAGFFGGRPLI